MDMFEDFYDLLTGHYHDSRLDPDLKNNEILILSLIAAIMCVAKMISDLTGEDFY